MRVSSASMSRATYGGGVRLAVSQFSMVRLGISKWSAIVCWVSPAARRADLNVVANSFMVGSSLFAND